MHDPFKNNAKYDDRYSSPDGWTGEVVDGDLYAFPRPRMTHTRAITRLARQLGPADDDDSPDGWVIVAEPCWLPDLAGGVARGCPSCRTSP